jgi:hypothetical protein
MIASDEAGIRAPGIHPEASIQFSHRAPHHSQFRSPRIAAVSLSASPLKKLQKKYN